MHRSQKKDRNQTKLEPKTKKQSKSVNNRCLHAKHKYFLSIYTAQYLSKLMNDEKQH